MWYSEELSPLKAKTVDSHVQETLMLTVHPQRMLVTHLLCTLTKYRPFPEQIATESPQNTISEPSVER